MKLLLFRIRLEWNLFQRRRARRALSAAAKQGHRTRLRNAVKRCPL
jgi:hypothetical protein